MIPSTSPNFLPCYRFLKLRFNRKFWTNPAGLQINLGDVNSVISWSPISNRVSVQFTSKVVVFGTFTRINNHFDQRTGFTSTNAFAVSNPPEVERKMSINWCTTIWKPFSVFATYKLVYESNTWFRNANGQFCTGIWCALSLVIVKFNVVRVQPYRCQLMISRISSGRNGTYKESC